MENNKTNQIRNFLKGIIYENPLLVSLLGLCPALAVTTSLQNSIAMGISFILVLSFSNIFISLLKRLIPYEIRIPFYIVIIASFVTIIEMLMQAYLPSLYENLGLFISLIVVNCIVLGRAEAFASKNNILDSLIDGLGMGIGYTLVLCLIGTIREVLGKGTITLWTNIKIDINKIVNSEVDLEIFTDFFVSPAGAFLVLAFVIAFVNSLRNKNQKIKNKEV